MKKTREEEAFLSFFQPGSNLSDAALAYASLRIHVFPLLAGEKRPLFGSHGVQDATTKVEQIKEWWSNEPQCNIGIGLRRSGVVILDIDPRHGGIDTLSEMLEKYGPLPMTYTVETGSGGRHYYFRVSADFYDSVAEDLPKKLGKGVDLLVNGYAVAPPSKLAAGNHYGAIHGSLEEDVARLPLQWLQAVALDSTADRFRQRLKDEGEDWFYPIGERNNGMTSYAGYLRRINLNAEDIFKIIKVTGQDRFESFEEITDKEIWQVAKSVERYPPAFNMTDLKIVYRGRKISPDDPEPVAFHGPIGEWVEYIEAITEAHPAALLAQALVIFGNMIGAKHREDPAPGFAVEGAWHRTGLYAMVVGDTAKAAKGDSWNRAWELMSAVEPQFKFMTGLQTGEGIIDYLADDEELDEYTTMKHGNKEERVQHKKKGSDADRRCMLYEPEFGRVLHVAERRGSVIKDILRDLWDKGETGKITAASKQSVTDATVSVVGHITRSEIDRDFEMTDLVNGFGNRFLYIFATRTKRLSSEKARPLTHKELRSFGRPLQEALEFARELAPEHYEFTEKAAEYWDQIDQEMWKNHPSDLINHLTARNRPIVRRLAIIYAVADRSPVVQKVHLQAAWALWKYCLQTAEYLFGDRIGHKIADRLYRALAEHPAGLSKMEIHRKVFQNNQSAKTIDQGLQVLSERGLIYSRKQKEGRKTVEFFFVKPDVQF